MAATKLPKKKRKKSRPAAMRAPSVLTEDERFDLRLALQHFAKLAASVEGIGQGTGPGNVAESDRLTDDEQTLWGCVKRLLLHLHRQREHQLKAPPARLVALVASEYKRHTSDAAATTASLEDKMRALLGKVGAPFDEHAQEALVVEERWIDEKGAAKQAAKEAVGDLVGVSGRTLGNWSAKDPYGQRFLRGAFGSTCTPAAATTYGNIILSWRAPEGHHTRAYQEKDVAIIEASRNVLVALWQAPSVDICAALTDGQPSTESEALLHTLGVDPADPGLRIAQSRRGAVMADEATNDEDIKKVLVAMVAILDGNEDVIRHVIGIPRASLE